jgi:predicted DNA-binding protein
MDKCYPDALARRISYLCSEAMESAIREVEYASLAGEGLEQHPYDVIVKQAKLAIRQLNQTIKEANSLKSHVHVWGSNDYCIHCGADGRA